MATIKMDMEIIWHTSDELPSEHENFLMVVFENKNGKLDLDRGDFGYYDPDGDFFRIDYGEYGHKDHPRSSVKYWAHQHEFPFPGA